MSFGIHRVSHSPNTLDLVATGRTLKTIVDRNSMLLVSELPLLVLE